MGSEAVLEMVVVIYIRSDMSSEELSCDSEVSSVLTGTRRLKHMLLTSPGGDRWSRSSAT